MGKVLEFPNDPKPFKPAPAVRAYIAQHKCIAVAWGRIPLELKHYLQQEAFVSDQKLSTHVCRILTTHALNPRQQGQCGHARKEKRAVA